MTAKRPSLKQATNRMLDGHYKVLTAIRDGKPVYGPEASAAMIRGYMRVSRTLGGWGAYSYDKTSHERSITDFGERLITAYEAKWKIKEKPAC